MGEGEAEKSKLGSQLLATLRPHGNRIVIQVLTARPLLGIPTPGSPACRWSHANAGQMAADTTTSDCYAPSTTPPAAAPSSDQF